MVPVMKTGVSRVSIGKRMFIVLLLPSQYCDKGRKQ